MRNSPALLWKVDYLASIRLRSRRGSVGVSFGPSLTFLEGQSLSWQYLLHSTLDNLTRGLFENNPHTHTSEVGHAGCIVRNARACGVSAP